MRSCKDSGTCDELVHFLLRKGASSYTQANCDSRYFCRCYHSLAILLLQCANRLDLVSTLVHCIAAVSFQGLDGLSANRLDFMSRQAITIMHH